MAATFALQRRFWSHSKRVALWLLLAWLLVNLAVPWFARDLHGLQGFGFPLGFWLTAQGALLVYLAIVVIDVVVMERLEARYRNEAARDAPQAAVVPHTAQGDAAGDTAPP